jgi:hypothetical protein
MVKYVKIVRDSKDGKQYVVIVDEPTLNEMNSNMAISVIAYRNYVEMHEIEGHPKQIKSLEKVPNLDDRRSVFHGSDAPLQAMRYLVEKFGLPNPMIWERP